MKNRRCLLAFLWCVAHVSHAAPNVLNNSTHAVGCIRSAATILGIGLDSTVLVDTDSLSSSVFSGNLIAEAIDTGRTDFSSIDSSPVNHAPYTVLSNSFSSYGTHQSSLDTQSYAALNASNLINNWAYVPIFTLPISTPPPIMVANISRSFGGGLTGGGVEFGMSSAYKGFDTTSPSCTTASFSAVLAAMKVSHPTWTWGDIKAALRQKSSNWATGYSQGAYGYGNIDYDAAVAIASTASLFLQPPLMTVSAAGNQLTLTLYPFRSTRRHHEVVYIVPTTYAWPVKNEYVLADITASAGTLLYSSNGTDVIPTTTVTAMQAPGNYYLIAFTADNLGAFSRVEPFSAIPVTVYGTGVNCS